MKTYLVTGAAGFIASRVCELLMAGGNRVIGIDSLNQYYDVRLKYYRIARLLGMQGLFDGLDKIEAWAAGSGPLASPDGRFMFHRMDVEDIGGLQGLFGQFEFSAVLNLAARAGVRPSIEHPHLYMNTNAIGTLNVLECMKSLKVPKLVLASTSSLYAGHSLPFSEELAVDRPLSPYAASKKAAEVMAYSYHSLYGMDVTILRYFTVFGPAGRPDMAPFRFIRWIDSGQPITVYGDGSQTRDFTYVDDIAEGTILGLRPLGYEILNLGGGNKPLSLHSMIKIMERTLGKSAVLDYKPNHSADMVDTAADISKAERLLGWRPKVGPEEGIRRTAAWHVDNRWLSNGINI